MQRPITRGAAANAGLIFHVFAQDSTSTTGAGKASVAFSSFSCRYIRNGEAISGAITPEDITTIGTYAAPTANTNIRIKAVDNTNMIGIYEVQLHADWVNTTNNCQSLTIYLTASGVAVLPIQIPLRLLDAQLLQATPTNITAGTITTATNLTNAPTAGDFTATMKSATLARVTLVDTLTTYTGNTPQTGDSYARIGALGAGLTAVDDATLAAIAALNNLSSDDTRAAVGLASANLDAQFATIGSLLNADMATAATRLLTTLEEDGAAGYQFTTLALENAPAGGSAPTVQEIRTEMDDNSTKLASIADLPTNAELATALGAADDATLAAIAALNNLSMAQVNAEADTALADVGLTTLITGRIDAAITTRMATFTYSAPPSAADISTLIASTLSTAHGAGSWATATGFSTLSIVDIRTAVGLATANLDTQIALIATAANLATANTALVKILAATYDTATVSGDVITLSNGATQTVTASGRVTG